MTKSVRLSAAEYEKKKTAIAGVIDFNDACGIKYSKLKLFKHFGVAVMTGYSWFPVTSKTQNIKNKDEPLGLKRTRSEDAVDEISALKEELDQTPAPRRQNPVRNDGRGRKRLKALVEDLTERTSSVSTPPPISPPSTADASPPPLPQQLLTPQKRKFAQAKKFHASNSGHQPQRTEEGVTDFKHENVDDDIFGEV
jgi:hypothetical protein